MFDRNERQFFSGQDIASVVSAIGAGLSPTGIVLQQTAPNGWTGRAPGASYGLIPKVLVSAMPIQNGFYLDVRVAPDFDSGGLVLFILSWFFFFPLAIILGVLAYQDWQQRQAHLFASVWGPVANRIVAPPAPQFGAGPPMAPGAWGPPP
jgi:hypothetical protein